MRVNDKGFHAFRHKGNYFTIVRFYNVRGMCMSVISQVLGFKTFKECVSLSVISRPLGFKS